MINLIYLSGNTTGGWVTFTAHLMRSLEIMGEECQLFKVGNRTENSRRPFGYGAYYRNLSLDDALKLRNVILVATAKNYREQAAALIVKGARVVLHDPTELRAGLAGLDVRRPWVIRKAVQAQVPGSVFIRHPYVRHEVPGKLPKRKGIISTSRIDFDKNTTMILDANRLGAGIRIHGFENRLYTKFKIMPNYPEWEQSIAAYPRDTDAAFKLLLGAQAMVDLSDIKGDGGGTQYTFLEAWDADAAVIIGDWWMRRNDDMVPNKNCFVISNPDNLASLCKTIRKHGVPDLLMRGGEYALRRHASKIIVPQVKEWLNARK